ncbi:hypothetical protein PCE1_004723 [Barthelona sp. PCE]
MTTDVRFLVYSSTKPGQKVCLVGNCPILGNWSLESGVKLRFNQTLKAHECHVVLRIGQELQYRYIVIDRNNDVLQTEDDYPKEYRTVYIGEDTQDNSYRCLTIHEQFNTTKKFKLDFRYVSQKVTGEKKQIRPEKDATIEVQVEHAEGNDETSFYDKFDRNIIHSERIKALTAEEREFVFKEERRRLRKLTRKQKRLNAAMNRAPKFKETADKKKTPEHMLPKPVDEVMVKPDKSTLDHMKEQNIPKELKAPPKIAFRKNVPRLKQKEYNTTNNGLVDSILAKHEIRNSNIVEVDADSEHEDEEPSFNVPSGPLFMKPKLEEELPPFKIMNTFSEDADAEIVKPDTLKNEEKVFSGYQFAQLLSNSKSNSYTSLAFPSDSEKSDSDIEVPRKHNLGFINKTPSPKISKKRFQVQDSEDDILASVRNSRRNSRNISHRNSAKQPKVDPNFELIKDMVSTSNKSLIYKIDDKLPMFHIFMITLLAVCFLIILFLLSRNQ